ncbi:MAG: NAD(P)/FAD-dependent oxidoreductase [Chlorobiota bacterium]
MDGSKKNVVIVGGGFGGLSTAKSLGNTEFEVTIIDKNNHHLFQPLLYQVATAALSPGDIAQPLRTELRNYKNVKVVYNEVIDINKQENKVILSDSEISYDYLILAPGATPNYFGNDDWENHAIGLKDLNDAINIRERVLESFERAESTSKENKLFESLTTFVIVGGGPTGVELAGSISEISRKTILKDFRKIKSEEIKIILVDGADRLLNTYSESLSQYTLESLTKMGVDVRLNTFVEDISEKGAKTSDGFIGSTNIIWAAGNKAAPLIDTLDTETDKMGRAKVNPDLSIPGHSNIFVIGDASYLVDPNGVEVPGVAQGAIQGGQFVAKLLKNKVNKAKEFKYFDKGNMATIGRARAIAEISGMKLKGLTAWLIWGFIHIFFLIDFRNRLKVILEWFWYYITFKPGASLILNYKKKDK